MHIDTQESLHVQHDKDESWDHDLLIETILKLLSGPFNNNNWSTWEVSDAQNEIETYLNTLVGTRYEKRSKRVLRKISKLETTKDIIIYLGDVLLSD